VNYESAALLVSHGITPQDFEEFSEEYDLLQASTGALHDPEVCVERPDHLAEVLQGTIVWLPGVAPYGDLWKDLRFGLPAKKVRLCPICYPPD
jgi:hypothetical protein